jgi:hypothetical protein
MTAPSLQSMIDEAATVAREQKSRPFLAVFGPTALASGCVAQILGTATFASCGREEAFPRDNQCTESLSCSEHCRTSDHSNDAHAEIVCRWSLKPQTSIFRIATASQLDMQCLSPKIRPDNHLAAQ